MPAASLRSWPPPSPGRSNETRRDGRGFGAIARSRRSTPPAEPRSRYRPTRSGCSRRPGWTQRTDGIFQPLVGGTLVAWGYRRSLVETPAARAATARAAAPPRPHRARSAPPPVRIPPGARLDLGGIAKSWIGARAAALLRARCDDPAVLVDAGGEPVATSGDHVVAVEARFSHRPAPGPEAVRRWSRI